MQRLVRTPRSWRERRLAQKAPRDLVRIIDNDVADGVGGGHRTGGTDLGRDGEADFLAGRVLLRERCHTDGKT